MARILLESLSGVGAIHSGEQLLRITDYELSIWSEGAAGTVAIEGHIAITGMGEAVVLAGPETLTLTLEDGRRLALRLASTGGQIASGSWLP